MSDSTPQINDEAGQPDPSMGGPIDPHEDTETAHLRAFLKLSYSERFHVLMHAIEFAYMLRPPEPVARIDEDGKPIS